MVCCVLGRSRAQRGCREPTRGAHVKEDFLEKDDWDKPVNRAVWTPLAGAVWPRHEHKWKAQITPRSLEWLEQEGEWEGEGAEIGLQEPSRP